MFLLFLGGKISELLAKDFTLNTFNSFFLILNEVFHKHLCSLYFIVIVLCYM